MLFYELLPQGDTVTISTLVSSRSSHRLLEKERPRRASVHLLHDIAWPFVAKETYGKLEELGKDTVYNSSYSPNPDPSENLIFRPLNALLAKNIFTKFEEVDQVVSDFFKSQSPKI
ncbi:hypothetical protein RB195_010782 [Necator americanus]|uniref:Uncharacterized protein n=1 Tax=Necator americanus TaxID=51031 RepID=A0ABR1D0I1_NECAM